MKNEISLAVAHYNLIRNDRLKLQESFFRLYPRPEDQKVFAPLFSEKEFKGFPEVKEGKKGLFFQISQRTFNITDIVLKDGSFKVNGTLLKWNANKSASEFLNEFMVVFGKDGKRASWNPFIQNAYAIDPVTIAVLGGVAIVTVGMCIVVPIENYKIRTGFEAFKKSVDDLAKQCKLKQPCDGGVWKVSDDKIIATPIDNFLPAGRTYLNDKLFVSEKDYLEKLSSSFNRGKNFLPSEDAKVLSEFYKQLKGTRVCVNYCDFKQELDNYNKSCQMKVGDENANSPRIMAMRKKLDQKLSLVLWPDGSKKIDGSLSEADYLSRMAEVFSKDSVFNLDQSVIAALYRDYHGTESCHIAYKNVMDNKRDTPADKLFESLPPIEAQPASHKITPQ